VFEDGSTLSLTVTDVEGSVIIVRPPTSAAVDSRQVAQVGWHKGAAWCVAFVREVQVPPTAASWNLVLDHEPTVLNRRRYVRGGGGEPVEVGELDARHGAVFVQGTVLDLSEGGVRCRLPSTALTSGDETTVHITLPEQELKLKGTVANVTRLTHGIEVILVFRDPTEREAQMIRKHLFQRERAERREGLR
jgi:hypothetical protein